MAEKKYAEQKRALSPESTWLYGRDLAQAYPDRVVGVTYDLDLISELFAKEGGLTIPDGVQGRSFAPALYELMANRYPTVPFVMIDGQMTQRMIAQKAEDLRAANTQLISFDDTLSLPGQSVVRETSFFDVNGAKMGPGLKPGQRPGQKTITLSDEADGAIIVDMGVWSGKTILPTVRRCVAQGVRPTVVTGFIKSKAVERLETEGAQVQPLLLSNYSDWAESRDLLTLFIKSGFYMGRRSFVDSAVIKPHGVFMGGHLTCYSQPSINLGAYYECMNAGDSRQLSRELLALSHSYWTMVEEANPEVTLGMLRSVFPTRFALPMLSQSQVERGLLFDASDRPSQAIEKMIYYLDKYTD